VRLILPLKLIEEHLEVCDTCVKHSHCEPHITNATFVCKCDEGFIGEGDSYCARKRGLLQCFVCAGPECANPDEKRHVAYCPHGVYACQMFVARKKSSPGDAELVAPR